MKEEDVINFLESKNYRHVSNYRQKMKERLVEYKGGKCEICGYNKCISALDFHHIDPSEKDFTISNSKVLSFEKCKSEVDKCILVCANCHREIHYNEVLKKRKENEIVEKEIFLEIMRNKKKYNVRNVMNSMLYLEELGILNDIKNNIPKKELIKKYHVSNRTINKFLKSKNIIYREQNAALSKPTKDELLELLKNCSKSAIGRMYGVTCNAVIKWCKKYGIEKNN